MTRKVYVNGDFVPADRASVSVFDHGYLYGDGVFEGIRAYNGRVFRLVEHVDRLYQSAHVLMLNIPLARDEMIEAVLETCRVNDLSDAYIRLIVSRGAGDLGLDPRKCTRPNIIIIADHIQLYPEELYQEGMRIMTVPTRRNHHEALNPRLKSLNYLNNIMAKIEAGAAGYSEVLMLNQDGYVVECTGDNIFLVCGGALLTPPASCGILKGITRAAVMDLALARGIGVTEELFTRYEVYTADECFLTGTAAELIPVIQCDGRSIGGGIPGPITAQLRADFAQLTKSSGTCIGQPSPAPQCQGDNS